MTVDFLALRAVDTSVLSPVEGPRQSKSLKAKGKSQKAKRKSCDLLPFAFCLLRFAFPLLAACAPRVAPAPVPVATDPAAVFAMVRQQEDRIHSLRARFAATVHHGETVRRAVGVLLIKKPDRFRLRLLSPFGFTVFDYVSQGSHARMDLPLEGKQLVDAEIGTQSVFSPLDFRQAFLRGEAAFPGRCTPAAAGAEVVVDCRNADNGRLREIRIARATGTVSREISFESEQPRASLQFDDYRVVDGVRVPFAIELRSPARDLTVQIAVRGYEINPVLADALFDAAGADGPSS